MGLANFSTGDSLPAIKHDPQPVRLFFQVLGDLNQFFRVLHSR
jgi:hypothetical protein